MQESKKKRKYARSINKKSGKTDIFQESDDDEDLADHYSNADYKKDSEDEDEEKEESSAEKRVRLAKQYLKSLENETRATTTEFDAEEIESAYITERLKKDALEADGKIIKKVADHYSDTEKIIHHFRGHQLSVTCVAVTDDETYVYSASKDCSIIKWELKTGKKAFTIMGGKKGTDKDFKGHTDHILGVAVSFDDFYVASCGKDKKICIWDGKTGQFLSSFKQHRNVVSSVVFRKKSHQLYSASHDKMVKLWDIDQMGYMDTLFGHEDDIMAIDAFSKERCITAGGQDRTIRLWKIVEESQLVFREDTSGSIDCVKLVNDQTFISGATDGTLSLWTINKKKPIYTVFNSHGENQWISSVAALPYTDLVASGSADGYIRIWKIEEELRSLKQILSVPVDGFVNSLAFSASGNYLVAGIGQEHRMGRWTKLKNARNTVSVILFKWK